MLALGLERADLTAKRAIAFAEHALVASGSPGYTPPPGAPGGPAAPGAPAAGLAMLQQAAAIASGVTTAALRAARGMYEANQYVARTIDIVRPISAEAVARAEEFKATALGDLLSEKQLQQLAQAQINIRDFAGGVIDSITSGVVTGAFGSNVDARAYTVGTFAGAVGMAVVEFMVFRTCTPGTLARIARIGFQIYNAVSIGIGVGRAIDNIIHDRAGVGDYLAFVPLLGAAMGKYFRACFEAGTQVIVGFDENGEAVTRNIEDIREGDYVLAGDENDPDAPPTLRRVTQVFIKTTHELRVLSFIGADGATTTLNTTDEHPFFVVNKGWVRADQLQIGDTLLQPDGSFVTLTASQIEARSQGVTVYNLEVEGGHTYFVDDAASGAAVWVHNYIKGPGTWQRTNEGMSAAAKAFQKKVTGRSALWSYIVKGTKFDGYRKGTLLDAKRGYRWRLELGLKGHEYGLNTVNKLFDQATRQLIAAGKTPIAWVFSDKLAAKIVKQLFKKNGIGINVLTI